MNKPYLGDHKPVPWTFPSECYWSQCSTIVIGSLGQFCHVCVSCTWKPFEPFEHFSNSTTVQL
jgi:hypothetical protein